MDLIINNNIIKEPIENIVYQLKKEANWQVFKDIQNKETWLRVTCPFHKDGQETHPSCSIFIDYNDPKVIPGTYHCFTCGLKGQLYQLVAFVLGITEEEGKTWLVDRYGNLCYESDLNFPSWEQPKPVKQVEYLNESILEPFKWYHPYLAQRKISLETAKKFSVGYNSVKNTITFPVWDEKSNLIMITERAINSKTFYIALVAWEYGYPAVALFGSGTTDHQIDILKKSGINNFILMYDNDEAGIKGANKFIKNIGKDKFVINIKMPLGKDVNDLTKDEFINLLKSYNILV